MNMDSNTNEHRQENSCQNDQIQHSQENEFFTIILFGNFMQQLYFRFICICSANLCAIYVFKLGRHLCLKFLVEIRQTKSLEKVTLLDKKIAFIAYHDIQLETSFGVLSQHVQRKKCSPDYQVRRFSVGNSPLGAKSNHSPVYKINDWHARSLL